MHAGGPTGVLPTAVDLVNMLASTCISVHEDVEIIMAITYVRQDLRSKYSNDISISMAVDDTSSQE